MQINKDKLPVLLGGEKKRTPGLFHHVVHDILPNMSLEEKHEHLLMSQKWRNSTKSIRS